MSDQSPEFDHLNETTRALACSLDRRIREVGDEQLIADFRIFCDSATHALNTTKPTHEGRAVALAENTRQAAPRTEPLTGDSSPHHDLVRRLGFGDNVTEPMANSDTIVAWFEERCREADEWREHERFRDECYAAGHSETEDCTEHGPACCNRAHVSTPPGEQTSGAVADAETSPAVP